MVAKVWCHDAKVSYLTTTKKFWSLTQKRAYFSTEPKASHFHHKTHLEKKGSKTQLRCSIRGLQDSWSLKTKDECKLKHFPIKKEGKRIQICVTRATKTLICWWEYNTFIFLFNISIRCAESQNQECWNFFRRNINLNFFCNDAVSKRGHKALCN